MLKFAIDDLASGYKELCQTILKIGDDVSPRGLRTKEIRSATIKVNDPTRTLPIGIGRKPNLAIGAVEALQLVGGFSDPPLMQRITKNFTQFMRAGSFDGAYGPRIRAQLPAAVRRLEKDLDTRQAIITIWDPLHDLFVEDSRDYPCTIELHFLVRRGALECHAYMRSNDVWWGVGYDLFQFSQIQCTVANYLNLPYGPLYHNATSLHMYERDFDKVKGLLAEPEVKQPPLFGLHGEDPTDFRSFTRRAYELTRSGATPRDETEEWYIQVLKPYV